MHVLKSNTSLLTWDKYKEALVQGILKNQWSIQFFYQWASSCTGGKGISLI